MSLEKITLKLGKKKIELTAKEFELLKQDMRELDTTYKWYWYGYRPTPIWYQSTVTGGSLSSSPNREPLPVTYSSDSIDYSGNVLAYTANE